jgi:diacylglycerol O-acyltransferase
VPLFNLVCSNTPGPQIPLHVMGHRLEAYYAHIPVGHQMGLACAIFSYNQKIFIDFVADEAACPDVETLKAFFESEFDELKAAAGVPSIAEIPLAAPERRVVVPARA